MTADPGGGAADGAVPARDSFLELRGLAKSFGDTRVLEDFTLGLGEGEILALLGLSGSGKTTALRLLAGFETPDEGTVRIGGQDVTALSPAARGFGMVFQHYALFPHMSVEQNIAFGLEAQGWDKGRIAPRVDEMLALVHLEGFGSRRVSEISGGQQQRVALGRALAPEPRLLLLDEPLSNLDPALRERTRQELRAAVRRVGITTVLVTHEQEEAFHVGDRVAVLNAGRLEQVGLPQELYRAPTSPFVATFIGRSGTLRGTLEAVDDLGAARVRLGDALWRGRARGPSARDLAPRAAVDFVVRPESLRLTEPQTPDALAGRVADHRFTGAATFAVIDLAVGGRVLVSSDDTEVGAVVHVVPALDGTARGGTAPSGHGPEPSVFPAGDPT